MGVNLQGEFSGVLIVEGSFPGEVGGGGGGGGGGGAVPRSN